MERPKAGCFAELGGRIGVTLGQATHHERRCSNMGTVRTISVSRDAPFPSGNFGGQAGPSQAKNPIVVKDRCPLFLR